MSSSAGSGRRVISIFISAYCYCSSLSSDRHVAQLKFVVREDADSLVVAANGDNGCLVEIWELREKPLPIHKLFQSKSHSSQPEPFKTVVSYAVTELFKLFLVYVTLSSCGPQLLSRCSDCLWAGWSGDRIPVGARFSAPVQTGPEAHPASCTVGTGSLRGVRCGRGVTLTPSPPCSAEVKNRVELYLYSP